MGTRQDKHPVEDNSFVDGFLDWMDSPEGELSGEVSDAVWALLEKTDVDAKNRKIIWEDGKRLSITESVQRIHAGYQDYPLELIEEHLIGWLEMEFAPPTYSQKQLDELGYNTYAIVPDQSQEGVRHGSHESTQYLLLCVHRSYYGAGRGCECRRLPGAADPLCRRLRPRRA